jgi:hypothetical protein
VYGGWDNAGGNINADPQFVDPGYWDDNGTPGDITDDTWVNGDYHLRFTSPCVDAGTNNAPQRLGTDFDGNSRIIDGDKNGTATIDMGIDELIPRIIVDFDGGY